MKKLPPRIIVSALVALVLLYIGTYIAFVTEPEFKGKTFILSLFRDEEKNLPYTAVNPTVTSTPEREVGAFVNQILNGEYEINSEESYQFHNGAYYFKYGPCKETCEPLSNYPDSNYTVTIDKNAIATGDLDGDGQDDSAVILGERYGGTGYFVSLAIFRNSEGKPAFVTLKDLGDRTIVKSISIKDGLLELSLLTHDSGEPMCCANTPKTIIYELVEGTLLEKN